MKTLLASALVILSLVTTSVHAQDDTIRVGMSGQYFPFTFVEQDTLKGFEVDVMNAVAKEMDREVEYQTAAFSGLFGMLGAGRIDTVANQITITEERQKAYLFSEPYVYDGAHVVTKAGNEDINGVEDLKGKTVAVNLGSNFEALLRDLPYADEIDMGELDPVTLYLGENALTIIQSGDLFVAVVHSTHTMTKRQIRLVQLAGAELEQRIDRCKAPV